MKSGDQKAVTIILTKLGIQTVQVTTVLQLSGCLCTETGNEVYPANYP